MYVLTCGYVLSCLFIKFWRDDMLVRVSEVVGMVKTREGVGKLMGMVKGSDVVGMVSE